MKMGQKILIISPYAFGYIDFLVEELSKRDEVDVDVIFFDKIKFKYKNFFERITNFFSKLFFNVNLKKRYIEMVIDAYDEHDKILIIRPDLLTDRVLKIIRSKTNNFIGYYFDSAIRLKRKQDIIHFFDKVYSFDKVDVEKFDFEFITNYIFEETKQPSKPEDTEYKFFNISSNDDNYRLGKLLEFIQIFQDNDWTFKFISFDVLKRKETNPLIETIDEIIVAKDAKAYIQKAKILIEIQRKKQTGLSFRVFEALGHQKKLITTNKDIVNYDFYNPQNILVVDLDNIQVPEAFVNTPYAPIDDKILDKYRLKNWVNRVFELEA